MIQIRNRRPTHPGAIIKYDYLEPLSLSLEEMAKHLGITPIALEKIVSENAPVTSTIALRLSKVLNTTPELWMGLQQEYDLWYAKHNSKGWENVQPIEMASNIK